MKLLQKQLGRSPLGIWLALTALFLLCLAWLMQAYSLLDWQAAIELGLQNESFFGDAGERAWARQSWGVAVADLLWAMPVTAIGIFGLLRRRLYGFICAMMAYCVGVYFPLVFAFQRWSSYRGTAIVALIVFAVPSLLGIAGLYANRRRFDN